MRPITFLSVIWAQSATAAARLCASVRGPPCDGAFCFALAVGRWLLEAAAAGVLLEEALEARLAARGASVRARFGWGRSHDRPITGAEVLVSGQRIGACTRLRDKFVKSAQRDTIDLT